MIWRTVAGGLSGLLGSLVWAVSLAIYQPLMQPTGFWTDPVSGARYPMVASNNTYWPRETRQLGILLAFGAVILICRAGRRGIIAGAVATAVWLGADLWLDRLDVSGRGMATWLTIAGSGFVVVTSLIAVRVSAGPDGTVIARQLTGGTAALLVMIVLVVSTPWDEPVVPPYTRIENALSWLQVGLVVGLLTVAIGLLATAPFTSAQGWAAAALVAFAGGAFWVQSTSGGGLGWGFVVGCAGTAVAVTAFRTVRPLRLLAAAPFSVAALVFSGLVALIFGMLLGVNMTRIAGNPGVNSADTDISIASGGLVVAVVLAVVSCLVGLVGSPSKPVYEPLT